MDRLGAGCERLPHPLHQREVGGAVKGKRCTASVVSMFWVWHGRELGACEVIAVHGNKTSYGWGSSLAIEGGVEGIEAVDYC